jgi:hypothetical protein
MGQDAMVPGVNVDREATRNFLFRVWRNAVWSDVITGSRARTWILPKPESGVGCNATLLRLQF